MTSINLNTTRDKVETKLQTHIYLNPDPLYEELAAHDYLTAFVHGFKGDGVEYTNRNDRLHEFRLLDAIACGSYDYFNITDPSTNRSIEMEAAVPDHYSRSAADILVRCYQETEHPCSQSDLPEFHRPWFRVGDSFQRIMTNECNEWTRFERRYTNFVVEIKTSPCDLSDLLRQMKFYQKGFRFRYGYRNPEYAPNMAFVHSFDLPNDWQRVLAKENITVIDAREIYSEAGAA